MNEAKSMDDCLVIEGYPIEGVSIAGHETCVILPTLKLAFDIGKCPDEAVSQPFVFISHGHKDHIGGLPLYVSKRGMMGMEPPTIFVPTVIKEKVENLFEAHRAIGHKLEYTLIGLDIGEEYEFGDNLKAKAFKTHHRVSSQGYVIYKKKPEYLGLPKDEDEEASPEVAFTGDTNADFIVDKDNADVLKAKILIMESTYIDNTNTIKDARDKGHTHLYEIINYARRFENKAILLIHFSTRHNLDDIEKAISALPPPLAGHVFALKKGFKRSKEEEPIMDDCLVLKKDQFKVGFRAVREPCVILPDFKLAFNIGKCPGQKKDASQPFIFITDGHMDHIGQLYMYVAIRGMQDTKLETNIFVPPVIEEAVENIFKANMALDFPEVEKDRSEGEIDPKTKLKYKLVGLDIGEERKIGHNHKAKAFKTYGHAPSQGYVIYSVKTNRKPAYRDLPKDEFIKLKLLGDEIEYEEASPEVGFTGDLIVGKDNVEEFISALPPPALST